MATQPDQYLIWPSAVPADGQIIIDVWTCRAYVARWRVASDGSFTIEDAANCGALEDDAASAVDDAGGSITCSSQYPCPTELAARALWQS